jgi:hypothetical protein
MPRCEVSGNDYDSTSIDASGAGTRFDCFECAIHLLAPRSDHGCRVVGHGVDGVTELRA